MTFSAKGPKWESTACLEKLEQSASECRHEVGTIMENENSATGQSLSSYIEMLHWNPRVIEIIRLC